MLKAWQPWTLSNRASEVVKILAHWKTDFRCVFRRHFWKEVWQDFSLVRTSFHILGDAFDGMGIVINLPPPPPLCKGEYQDFKQDMFVGGWRGDFSWNFVNFSSWVVKIISSFLFFVSLFFISFIKKIFKIFYII